eukprot:TRINITY_DN8492_c0_g1_i8.p1 TRINITY_DN8492_c0_g1~~TRINITY_DN8492_c0_g1_i8.p1  ORF type:complete len:377 (+),score=78.29 TRINITY_DN8492_c0_g1_i8:229-1359(+)
MKLQATSNCIASSLRSSLHLHHHIDSSSKRYSSARKLSESSLPSKNKGVRRGCAKCGKREYSSTFIMKASRDDLDSSLHSRKSTSASVIEYADDNTDPHNESDAFEIISIIEQEKHATLKEKLKKMQVLYLTCRVIINEGSMESFKDSFLEKVEQESRMIPFLKVKIDKLKRIRASKRKGRKLLQGEAIISRIIEEKERQSREKYEGYIKKLQELFYSGRDALSDLYSFAHSNRVINKEQRIKELDIQVAELKSDIEVLKKALAEKENESAAATDEHKATIVQLREELARTQTLLGIAESKSRQLTAALHGKNKELQERDGIIKRQDSELRRDERRIERLSAKVKSGKVAKTCVPVLLLALLVCIFGMLMAHGNSK